jgi:colanic acid biosynthesis glycosyl transferase WcaI
LRAEKVIALDHFMKKRIVAKGVAEDRVVVLPPWAHDNTVRYDEEGRRAFREQHDLTEKFVVMYAGNHSPCHPLDTLIEAARELSSREDIVFCFVGGGSEQRKVREFAARHNLTNILCLPYQPFDTLAAALSAADLHTVVMGNSFVGIVHPSKVYNILTIGSPFLYIGPGESHISEIALQTRDTSGAYSARNGDVAGVVKHILDEAKRKSPAPRTRVSEIANTFSRTALLPRMIDLFRAPAAAKSQDATQSETASYLPAAR